MDSKKQLEKALEVLEINEEKIKIPTPSTKDVEKELEESHVGFKEQKERFADFINLYLDTGGNFSPTREVICYVGAPGTGKTSFAQALAKVMGRFCKIIPCAGLKNLNVLGNKNDQLSMVGATMAECGSSNPIIILDELEKVEEGSQIQADLIELFGKYKDKKGLFDQSCAVDINLNHITFIATVNYPEQLAPLLKKEVAMYYLKDYEDSEKEQILKQKAEQIEKSIREICGDDQLKFPVEVIKPLLGHIHGVGVRPTERALFELKKQIIYDQSFTLNNPQQ